MRYLKLFTRNKFLLLYDFFASVLIYVITKIFLNLDVHSFTDIFTVETIFDTYDILYFLCTIFIYYLVTFISQCYQVMWMHAGTNNYIRLILSVLISSVLTTIISCLFFTGERFAVLFNLFFVIWVILSRMAVRGLNKLIKLKKHKAHSKSSKNVLIIGAGDGGTFLLHELTTNTVSNIHYNVVGFVDDDIKKKNSLIEDVKVLGTTDDLLDICQNYSVDEILFAIPSVSAKSRIETLNKCSETGCRLKIMVSAENALLDESNGKFITRNVEIEDLLDRESVKLDISSIEKDIHNKVVMVTGGGGSIGSELCRQIAKFSPSHLIILDIYENNAYELQMEINESHPDLSLSVVIASVRDEKRIDNIMDQYKPHIIFHAAAHKHVPLMESSPSEAIKNNVLGTYNMAKCSDKHNVSKFVMISTDKAVNPTNVMGATKRMCEMIIQAMDKESKTKFVAVRFGNVLGSNGSVIPLFKRQIAHGGPVTVTHKEITRFFMTIPEASQLVLQAAANANGGEIFVLDMGSPVKIYDLAVNLIRLSGYTPDVDIPIHVTGLRPGEKLYEELLMTEEGLTDTSHSKIFIGKPSSVRIEEVEQKISILVESLKTNSSDDMKEAIGKVVPTYKRTDN